MTHELRSGCPIAASLDILGDRWTLVVLRDMLLGDRTRFSELAVDESIATNILTDRLHRLVEGGLVEKTADPVDGRRVIYRPLLPAIDLIPVLAELVAWGSRHTAVPENPVFAAFVNPETREAAVSQVMARLTAQLV
ncbi:helix-turn-helix domain-containing protein [Chryseoglobus sp. 28M-23]|uniref:winged helix-turn-helix transcriptional regulator n=1 Tax=Chryseoglobus sp. 28M-23 TaxID=2772253 RepID=UPI0017463505|nr:helix-turn-helix domain-containing protein [Chryseoglobus sp. 28M-23]QOD93707.1 helix-turn-helix transcriptional regulator [Chryseoglobus sp. 28M-23]